MAKPIIRQMKTQEYEGGCVYTLTMETVPGLHEILVPFLISIGLSGEKALLFDLDLVQSDADVFVAQDGLRAHLIARESEAMLILHVARPFAKVISTLSRFFTLLQ